MGEMSRAGNVLEFPASISKDSWLKLSIISVPKSWQIHVINGDLEESSVEGDGERVSTGAVRTPDRQERNENSDDFSSPREAE
jgi:hypothetical protein